MRTLSYFSCLVFFWTTLFLTGDAADPEQMKLAEEWRQSIPLGGNFQPNPKEPVFVLVGQGARLLGEPLQHFRDAELLLIAAIFHVKTRFQPILGSAKVRFGSMSQLLRAITPGRQRGDATGARNDDAFL